MKFMCVVATIVLVFFVNAHNANAQSNNICSNNTNGRTALCGEEAGKCYFQAIWGGPSSFFEIGDTDSFCCYNPNTQECSAGTFNDGDTVATPVVTPKRDNRVTGGVDLKACGVVSIPQTSTCTYKTSCSIIGFSGMCPFSFICTDDASLCPETSSQECPGANQGVCNGVCYNQNDNFCLDSEIYSKETYFKCDGQLYDVMPSQRCCGDNSVYNPSGNFCSGGTVYASDEFRLCAGTPYEIAINDCSAGRIVALGNEWGCGQEYDPEVSSCERGVGIAPKKKLCAAGESFALNRCYVAGSAVLGDSCAANDQCTVGKCNGIAGLTRGTCVCQTDNDCGSNSICKKAGKNKCRATRPTSCPSGWSYEERNPTNKDRCHRTTVESSALKCKLGTLDKAKNWTGPHAQSGMDECRSTKGKNPKDVKCSSGYNLNIRSGADTCTRSNDQHQTPTCPSGWDYKSQGGRDICQDK